MTLKLIKAVTATVVLLAACGAAQSADMPIKAPYYKGAPAVSYYNWTGFYAGINGGYGFGTSTWSALPGDTIKPKGGMFGATVGYNWQAGSLVYGVEGDIDWADVKGSITCGVIFSCGTDNRWLATFRGRLGYAFDRWMPYVTAGGAYGDVRVTASLPVLGLSNSVSKDQLGWTVGAGIEYAMFGNWTAKLEYLYVDLGSFTAATLPAINDVSFKENIIRAGLNYKFSGPIFSRY